MNMPEAQTIDQRIRITEEAIRFVVQQIVEKFHPQRIILFGSYAWGQPRPESDVDLMVIMDTPLQESEQALQICQQVEYIFGLDLLVYKPDHFKQRIQWGDSFLREVLERGKVLYESSDS